MLASSDRRSISSSSPSPNDNDNYDNDIETQTETYLILNALVTKRRHSLDP